MKKFTYMFIVFAALALLVGATAQAQNVTVDFESRTIGDTVRGIAWSATDVLAVVADDSVAPGNKVLKTTIKNYNAAPVIAFTLPAGKTLASYNSFTFKALFASGDVGYKDILVEAYQTMPTGQFANNTAARIGSWTRSQNGSTAWENITVSIPNTSMFSGTIYIAVGINCAGTGSVGGAGSQTIWWADDLTLVAFANPSITQWGKTAQGKAWPIINSAVAGNAGIGGSAKPTAWATIRGGFDTLTATTSQAVVVSGQMEFVGGGGASAYTWLRYALTYQDSSTLSYAGTDTAEWASPLKHYGYGFHPRSGTGTMSNGGGGQGTVWTISNGSWSSTWSNGGKGPLAAVKQAPRNAVAAAGIYNWAISVRSINDTVNEIRWSMVETTNKYWFGGTVNEVSTSKKFNGVNFGFNNDMEATRVNLIAIKAELGTPITIPEAPWQAYYVDQWGKTAQGKAWPIIWNDTTGGQPGTVVGDAGIGGSARPTAWSTIRGGFGDPISITTAKAIIVSGQMEFVGGGGASAYTWLRYALTFQDSSKLRYRGTDTAEWIHTIDSLAPLKHYGYGFHPRSGTGTMSNGGGGQGTVWTISNGSWTSTWSNGGKGPLAAIKQAPRNAVAAAGTYNWAISVRSINDTVNEIKWSMVEVTNKYWFGGTVNEVSTSKKFNGVNFGFNNDMEATRVNLIAVKVDLGTPITIPEAPWQAYYVDQWGKTAQGKAWPIIWNDTTGGQPGTIVGDAGIGGSARPTAWSTIRGGFGDPISITTAKAIIVSGQMEFVGGGGASAYTWLRYALTFQDSSKLRYRGTDTAEWIHTIDSLAPLKHYGYGFHPRSGTGTMSNGGGGQGTVWTISNGSWTSTWSNGGKGPLAAIKQAPRNAVAAAGTYNWAISVRSINDTVNEIKWSMVEVTNKYWFGGTVNEVSTSKKFNGVNFGFNNDMEATRVNLIAVKVDLGTPITIPEEPWQAYYVDQWGIYGSRYGGWTFEADPEKIVGNAGIGGAAANTDYAAIRAGFDPFTLKATRRLLVTGKVEFVGGGFEANNLRFGVFNSDNPGTLIIDTAIATLPDSTRWTGSENSNSGYLIIPTSGTNAPAVWNGIDPKQGTFGTVTSDIWLSTGNGKALGSKLQTPENAEAGAGIYDFAISVTPTTDGKNEVRYKLNNGASYIISEGTIDNTPVSTRFNCIAFALNKSTSTTAMKFTDVLVDTGIVNVDLTDIENTVNALPTVYALNQNYPNPFNPSTTIRYDLPSVSQVKLTVYDLLGRVVATLVDQQQQASRYEVQWNATNLSSGVYFYRIDAKSLNGAKDFTAVKKLLLMK